MNGAFCCGPADTSGSSSCPRRKRRDTTVSSPGGVSMSSESETGDFTPRIPNAAPAPSSSHLPPRFKKDCKQGAFHSEAHPPLSHLTK